MNKGLFGGTILREIGLIDQIAHFDRLSQARWLEALFYII
jgi:hypothetical protein